MTVAREGSFSSTGPTATFYCRSVCGSLEVRLLTLLG
jgi:hypothetical protein